MVDQIAVFRVFDKVWRQLTLSEAVSCRVSGRDVDGSAISFGN